jgi:hypothetical protein
VTLWAVVKRRLERTLVAAWLLAALGLLIFSGCTDNRPLRVPVSGRVLIDGQPLTLGNVKFVPSGGRPSSAKIDGEGRFTLTCYDGEDGAIPGTHRVAVSASKILSESKVEWFAPKKYADFRTSGLSYEITEPTDDLTIELTWDGGKPFVE